jgi:hypothetical protein
MSASAGTYPLDHVSARWDGHAWDGSSSDELSIDPAPVWQRRPLPFLGKRWFWLMVLGALLVFLPAWLASGTDNRPLAVATLIGFALFLSGSVLIVGQHVRFDELASLRSLIAWGIASGVVGFALASTLESGVEPRLTSFGVELWLAGPVEETAKLLVPVALLVFGGARFADPRGGLLLGLISGAVFGALEGVLYVAGNASGYGIAYYGLVRPTAELMHPWLTGFAAAVIWLAAWRAGRTFTVAGVIAWLAAVALHSLHDGIVTLGSTASPADLSFSELTPSLLAEAAALNAYNIIWAVILFLVCRHAARELVPPDAVSENPPHWRPQLKQWGVRAQEPS